MEGIGAVWLFRYETLRRFALAAIPAGDVAALGLPSMVDDELDEDVLVFRSRRDLDDYRHPGYPDDVAVAYGHDVQFVEGGGMGAEQLWVRVHRVVDDSEFEGALLNRPAAFRGMAGDEVRVTVYGVGSGRILGCLAPMSHPD